MTSEIRGDDVDASLDHRHDLVPFAFECGEHGRGFVRQARLADRLDRGRNRLGHGAVGLIGRHRRNGKCKQHRARLAPASVEAHRRRSIRRTMEPISPPPRVWRRRRARPGRRRRASGGADGWPSRARKRTGRGATSNRQTGSASASVEARLHRGLGGRCSPGAAGVSFQSSAIGVGPQTAWLRDWRPSTIGVRPRPASVSDRRRPGLFYRTKN